MISSTSNTPLSVVTGITVDKDTTDFIWTVGRFKTVRFGDSVSMNCSVSAGGNSWKLSLFPKGITDPDWASLYVTNIECLMDEGDPVDRNRITTTTLASVTVKMIPEPPNQKKGRPQKEDKRGDSKGELKDGMVPSSQRGGSSVKDDDAASSAPSDASSARSGISRQNGSKKASSSKGGNGSATSSSGTKSAGVVQPIEKKLSQQFTNKDKSWGWDKFLDMDKLYNSKSGYLNAGEVRDSSTIQDGSMKLYVKILAITGILQDPPENDPAVTPGGRQRTSWTIRDFSRLVDKVSCGQKLSSAAFSSDGDWFFDLYAKGYQEILDADQKDEGYMSFYLHSTRSQADHGHVKKQSFKLGIKKSTPLRDDDPENVRKVYELLGCLDPGVYFPPGSSCTARFDSDKKCYGKLKFLQLQELQKGRNISDKLKEKSGKYITSFGTQIARELVAGTYGKGGSVTFVMDMAVTDEETNAVQLNLMMTDSFGNDLIYKCSETGKPFKATGTTSAWCRLCGKHFSADLLRVSEVSRLPQFGYEIGLEFLMDRIMREEEHQLFKIMVEFNMEKKFQKFKAAVHKKIGEVRAILKKEPEPVDGALVPTSHATHGHGHGHGHGQASATHEPTPLEKRKAEMELKAQNNFNKWLNDLRRELEDATFAKPVCSRCFEACKELHSLRTGPNKESTCMAPTIWRKDTPLRRDPKSKAAQDWRDFKRQVDAEYEGVKKCFRVISIERSPEVKKLLDQERGEGSNALTLVRGSWFVDPPELSKQCHGRVHPLDPLGDDDELLNNRTAFCDVRFDRLESKPNARKAPDRHFCVVTGRVFCASCVRWNRVIPEFEATPGAAGSKPVPVCYDANLEREVSGRLQPVSKKQADDGASKSKKALKVEAVEEEEEDGDPWQVAMVRKIPWCGESFADKLNPDG